MERILGDGGATVVGDGKAEVCFTSNQSNMGEFLLDHFGRAIGRCVIDNDNLMVGAEGREAPSQLFACVVADNDDADRQGARGKRI